MDASDHVGEVVHAHINATGFSEEAVVELMLEGLSVVGSISDGLSVLLLSVASPHSVDGLLAS